MSLISASNKRAQPMYVQRFSGADFQQSHSTELEWKCVYIRPNVVVVVAAAVSNAAALH